MIRALIKALARQALRFALGTNPRQKDRRMSEYHCERETMTGQWIEPEVTRANA